MENKNTKVKGRVCTNILIAENKEVFGIQLMVHKSRRYCKYPVGHQEYTTKKEAKTAMSKIVDAINNNNDIVCYPPKGSSGINKPEYVFIEGF